MKLISVLVLGLVLLYGAACGGDATQTQTPQATSASVQSPTRPPIIVPTPPPGWTLYSRSTYQIALPDSWKVIELEEQALQQAISEAQNNNPPLAEQLRKLVESGLFNTLAFYAVEESGTPILKNVSLARTALESTNDLEGYVRTYAETLPKTARGSRVVELRVPLKLNGMNAAHMVYDVSLVDGAGNLATLRGVQYLYLLDSGAMYIVTITGDAEDIDAFMHIARQIGTSFVGITR